MNDVRQAIRGFILTTALPGESSGNLQDVTPLQSSGILDSLAVLQLAAFIKDRFGVDLDVYDTSVERFDRIADIAALIEKRQRELRSTS